MTQERFFELVYAWKDGDLTGDELYKRVFVLSNVVGRSEQLVCPNCDGEGFSGKGTTEVLPCLSCFGSGERAD